MPVVGTEVTSSCEVASTRWMTVDELKSQESRRVTSPPHLKSSKSLSTCASSPPLFFVLPAQVR